MPGPLDGMTVVECSSIVLGPMATQMLGDLGADVIKVEPPEGDLTRQIGPGREPRMGALFMSCNRNKRSVVIDLKSPEGKAQLLDLVAGADVFLHSVRAGAAARLGIGYEQLSGRNPRLVHCHVKGFGDSGAYAGKAAYDDVVQALSGLAMLQTVVTGQPRYVPSIVADKVTGVHAAAAIGFALLHRERTGEGQHIDVSMFETMAAFNLVEHLWGAVFEPPLAPMGYPPVATASRRPFRTKDGFLAVMPYSDADWLRFFTLIDRPDLASDARFATLKGRQDNVTMVWDELEAQLSLRESGDWQRLLTEGDIPFAAVQSLEDLLVDPHLESVGFWERIGDLRLPASPFGLAASPPSIRLAPPRLGEHTEEILAGVGR